MAYNENKTASATTNGASNQVLSYVDRLNKFYGRNGEPENESWYTKDSEETKVTEEPNEQRLPEKSSVGNDGVIDLTQQKAAPDVSDLAQHEAAVAKAMAPNAVTTPEVGAPQNANTSNAQQKTAVRWTDVESRTKARMEQKGVYDSALMHAVLINKDKAGREKVYADYVNRNGVPENMFEVTTKGTVAPNGKDYSKSSLSEIADYFKNFNKRIKDAWNKAQKENTEQSWKAYEELREEATAAKNAFEQMGGNAPQNSEQIQMAQDKKVDWTKATPEIVEDADAITFANTAGKREEYRKRQEAKPHKKMVVAKHPVANYTFDISPISDKVKKGYSSVQGYEDVKSSTHAQWGNKSNADIYSQINYLGENMTPENKAQIASLIDILESRAQGYKSVDAFLRDKGAAEYHMFSRDNTWSPYVKAYEQNPVDLVKATKEKANAILDERNKEAYGNRDKAAWYSDEDDRSLMAQRNFVKRNDAENYTIALEQAMPSNGEILGYVVNQAKKNGTSVAQEWQKFFLAVNDAIYGNEKDEGLVGERNKVKGDFDALVKNTMNTIYGKLYGASIKAQSTAREGDLTGIDAMRQSISKYMEKNKGTATVGGLLNLALELPAFGLANKAGKATVDLFMKGTADAMSREIGVGITRALESRFGYQALNGALGFGYYNLMSEGAEQLYTGEFDGGKLVGEFAKGAIMGSALSGTSRFINFLGRNVGQSLRATAGMTMAQYLGEVGTFTALSAAETYVAQGKLTWDDFVDIAKSNLYTITGMKLQGAFQHGFMSLIWQHPEKFKLQEYDKDILAEEGYGRLLEYNNDPIAYTKNHPEEAKLPFEQTEVGKEWKQFAKAVDEGRSAVTMDGIGKIVVNFGKAPIAPRIDAAEMYVDSRGVHVITRDAQGKLLNDELFTSEDENMKSAMKVANERLHQLQDGIDARDLQDAGLRYSAAEDATNMMNACGEAANELGMTHENTISVYLQAKQAEAQGKKLTGLDKRVVKAVEDRIKEMTGGESGALRVMGEVSREYDVQLGKVLEKPVAERTIREQEAVEEYRSRLEQGVPEAKEEPKDVTRYTFDDLKESGDNIEITEADLDTIAEDLLKNGEDPEAVEEALEIAKERLAFTKLTGGAERMQSVTKKDGNSGVVVSGEVVLKQDGTIDKEASTDEVVMLNSETGRCEIVKVGELETAEPMMSAEEYKTATIDESVKAERAAAKQMQAQQGADNAPQQGAPEVSGEGKPEASTEAPVTNDAPKEINTAADAVEQLGGGDVEKAKYMVDGKIKDAKKALDEANRLSEEASNDEQRDQAWEAIKAANAELAKWEGIREELDKPAQTESQSAPVAEGGEEVTEVNNNPNDVTVVENEKAPIHETPGMLKTDYTKQVFGGRNVLYGKALDWLAKQMGVQLRFMPQELMAGGQAEGQHLRNQAVIEVAMGHEDRNALKTFQKGLRTIVGHEFMHRLRMLNDNTYQGFKEVVKTTYGKDMWDAMVTDLQKTYDNNIERVKARISGLIEEVRGGADKSNELADAYELLNKLQERRNNADKIEEEVVADAAGDVMNADRKLLIELMKSQSTGLKRMAIDFVDYMLTKYDGLRNFFTKEGTDLMGTDIKEYWGEKKNLEKLVSALKESILEATKNMDNPENAIGKKEGVKTEDGEVVMPVDGNNNLFASDYSLTTYRDYTDDQGRRHEGTRTAIIRFLRANNMPKDKVEDFVEHMDYWEGFFKAMKDLTDEKGGLRFEKFKEWNDALPPKFKKYNGGFMRAISTMITNGEYPVNVELSTDCIKREAFTQVLNKMVEVNGTIWQNLTPENITKVQDLMKAYGLQVACPLCFVEGKRMNIMSWAEKVVDKWNNALAAYTGRTDSEAFGFGEGVKVPDAPVADGADKVALNMELDKVQKMLMQYDRLDGDTKASVKKAQEQADQLISDFQNEWLQTHDELDDWVLTEDQANQLRAIWETRLNTTEAKMNSIIAKYPELRKKLSVADLVGSKGLMAIREKGEQAFDELFSVIVSANGTGTPKIVQDAQAYSGELLEVGDNKIKKADMVGGSRMFSFSDFDITKTFDIMQILWDASARQAKMQSYSKEVPYILMFGKSGIKINMSALVDVKPNGKKAMEWHQLNEAYERGGKKNEGLKKQMDAIKKEVNENAGLMMDADGNIVGIQYSDSHSLPEQFCKSIFYNEGYNADCGTIMVGVSVNHSLYSMLQDYIRMVIPFHESGMTRAAKVKSDCKWYRDFTDTQNTGIIKDGVRVKAYDANGNSAAWYKEQYGKDMPSDYDFYKGEGLVGDALRKEDPEYYNFCVEHGLEPKWDMRQKVEHYVNWCEANHLVPKFEWAVNADAYVKWCEEQGYTPNEEILQGMKNKTKNGMTAWEGYYKCIADYNCYKPVFDESGKVVGEVAAPHNPVNGRFDVSDKTLGALFTNENSMLGNRERTMMLSDNKAGQIAAQAVSIVNSDGAKTVDDFVKPEDRKKFANSQDADVYATAGEAEGDVLDYLKAKARENVGNTENSDIQVTPAVELLKQREAARQSTKEGRNFFLPKGINDWIAGVEISGAEKALNADIKKKFGVDGKISARGNALYLSELSGKPEDIARFMEVMKQYGELNGVEIKTDNDFDPNDPTTPSGGGGRRDDVDFSLRAGSFFTGGGLVEDAMKGVIDGKFGVEFDSDIAAVFRDNYGNHIINADVRSKDVRVKVRESLGGKELEYFHASPVCKNYSRAKREGGESELDIETAKATADFIREFTPGVVTIENAADYGKSSAVNEIISALKENGYTIDFGVYNAKDFGGYIDRKRFILRAAKDGNIPSIAENTEGRGWYEAVEDLIPTLKKTELAPWQKERLANEGIDVNNVKEPLIVYGGSSSKGKTLHAYASEVAPSINTKNSGSRIIMPNGDILMCNPRVFARIMGLSDNYKLPSDTLAYKIIGNGVPSHLTDAIIKPLVEAHDKTNEGDVDFSIEEINKYAESVETKRPTDEVKRNIKSGLSALRMLANGKEVVHGAMNRPDIEKYGGDSSISFYFGKVGIPDKNYKKGYGISHIAAKHGKDTLLKVLNTIAIGDVDRYVPGNKQLVLTDGKYEAALMLTRFGDKETWLLSGWDKIETTGDSGEVSATSTSTQNSPTFSRAELGAVISDANLRRIFIDSKKKGINPLDASVNTDDDVDFALYGGNSGYVGYSMSKRAEQAREEGRFPKGDFKKEYGVTEAELKALVNAGVIDDSEWHHTSKFGNKTTFYGWNDESAAEKYRANKAAVKKIAKGINPETGEPLVEKPVDNGLVRMKVSEIDSPEKDAATKELLAYDESMYRGFKYLDLDGLGFEERSAAIKKYEEDVAAGRNEILAKYPDYAEKLRKVDENNAAVDEFESKKFSYENDLRRAQDAALEKIFGSGDVDTSLVGGEGESAADRIMREREAMRKDDGNKKAETLLGKMQKRIDELKQKVRESRAEAKESDKTAAGLMTNAAREIKKSEKERDALQESREKWRAKYHETVKNRDQRVKEVTDKIAALKKENRSAAERAKILRDFISDEINKDIAREMGKQDLDRLNKLLTEIAKPNEINGEQKLQDALTIVARTATGIELKRQGNKFVNLITTRLQRADAKRVAHGVKVDNDTRTAIEAVKEFYLKMKENPFGKQMFAAYKERKEIQNEIDAINESLNNVNLTDEEKTRLEQRKADLTDMLDVANQNIDELKAQKTDAQSQLVPNGRQAFDKLKEELENEYADELDGKRKMLPSRKAKLKALPVIEKMVNMREVMENANEALAQAKEFAQAKDFDGARAKLVEYDSLRKEALQHMTELNVDLGDLIEDGRCMLLEAQNAKMAHAQMVAQLGINAAHYDKKNGKRGSDVINANADKQDADEGKYKVKMWLLKPTESFEHFLNVIDYNNFAGEGELYEYFMKGDRGFMASRDNFVVSMEAINEMRQEANKKFFGRKEGPKDRNKTITATEAVYDAEGNVVERFEVSHKKGAALSIYLWAQSESGRAKLKAQGIDESSIAEIEQGLGKNWIEYGKWIQGELLPALREKYNEKHIDKYGTSLGEEENYFPFKIYKNDIRMFEDIDAAQAGDIPSFTPSAIRERRNHDSRLDVSNDAIDILENHINEMEDWYHFADFRDDLTSLLNSLPFKAELDKRDATLYKRFRDSALAAAGLYDKKMAQTNQSTFDKRWIALNKSLASGAISWRMSTAFKQLQSIPAFINYSADPRYWKHLAKAISPLGVTKRVEGVNEGNWFERLKFNYSWAKEFLPNFRERIRMGDLGRIELRDKGFSEAFDKFAAIGMIPNKTIDAFSCALGAKAVYDYRYEQFKKQGFSDDVAHRKAIIEAELAYNQTQQSSEAAFRSTMQSDPTGLSRSLTTFQTAAISYFRKQLEAWSDVSKAIRFVREGKMEAGTATKYTAGKAAGKLLSAAGRVAMYGFFLNWTWPLMSKGINGVTYSLYANLFGNEEDVPKDENGNPYIYFMPEDEEGFLPNYVLSAITAPVMGTPLGNIIDSLLQRGDYQPIMLVGEIANIAKDGAKIVEEFNAGSEELDKQALFDTFKVFTYYFFKGLTNINPDTWANIYNGIARWYREGFDVTTWSYLNNGTASGRREFAKYYYLNNSGNNFLDYAKQRADADGAYFDDMEELPGSLLSGIETQLSKEQLKEKKYKEYFNEWLSAKDPSVGAFVSEEEEHKDNVDRLKLAYESGTTTYEQYFKALTELNRAYEEKRDAYKKTSDSKEVKLKAKIAKKLKEDWMNPKTRNEANKELAKFTDVLGDDKYDFVKLINYAREAGVLDVPDYSNLGADGKPKIKNRWYESSVMTKEQYDAMPFEMKTFESNKYWREKEAKEKEKARKKEYQERLKQMKE